MFRIISLICLAFLCLFKSQAQLGAVSYDNDEFPRFAASKTYVVQTGNITFDTSMVSAMKDSWKITPFDFISGEQFNTLVKDKTASFIMPVTISTENGHEYHFLTLVNGGRKSIDYYVYSNMLAYAVINHFGDEPNDIDCAFRLRNMVAAIANTVDIVQKNKIKGSTKSMVDKLMKYYRTLSYKIPDRILLVNKDALGDKMTEEEFGKVYPNRFEFCSRQKLAQVIAEKDARYYYFQPGLIVNKSLFVFDPVTGEVLFADYALLGRNINKRNVEMLVDAINGK